MIRRILLDIDDVCNQCTMYALQWLGVPMDYDLFYETYPSAFGYNIVNAANHFLGYNRFTVKSFWSMIPRVFWASCPPSNELELILDRSEKLVGRDRICLLTGPTKDPDCLAGKLEWITDVLPPWLHRQYLIGPRKWFCGHPEALLIDDADANVDWFRKEGGHGLLVPRPWNTNHLFDTSHYLTEAFDRLAKECQTVPA